VDNLKYKETKRKVKRKIEVKKVKYMHMVQKRLQEECVTGKYLLIVGEETYHFFFFLGGGTIFQADINPSTIKFM
jgi:hypothetical protein